MTGQGKPNRKLHGSQCHAGNSWLAVGWIRLSLAVEGHLVFLVFPRPVTIWPLANMCSRRELRERRDPNLFLIYGGLPYRSVPHLKIFLQQTLPRSY